MRSHKTLEKKPLMAQKTHIDKLFLSASLAIYMFSFFSHSELESTLILVARSWKQNALSRIYINIFNMIREFACHPNIAGRANLTHRLFLGPKISSHFPTKEDIDQIAIKNETAFKKCLALGDILKKPLSDYLDMILSKPLSIDQLNPEPSELLLRLSSFSLKIIFQDYKIYKKLLKIQNQLVPLFVDSAESNRLGDMLLLLQKGADINGDKQIAENWWPYNDGFTFTALMVALRRDASIDATPNYNTIKFLLSNNANVNNAYDPPLFWCLNSEPEMLQMLLDHKANPNIVGHDKHPWTPLSLAASHGNIKTIKLLLENKADIHHKTTDIYTTDDFTALKWAILSGRCRDRWKDQTDKPDLIQLFLQQGADIEERTTWWHWRIRSVVKEATPLMMAAAIDKTQSALVLLDNKANIHAKAATKWTPIMFAAATASPKMVKLLISHRANLEDRTSDSYFAATVKSIASKNPNHEVAKLINEEIAKSKPTPK